MPPLTDAPTAGFYVDYQYQRAYWFLGNMTELIFNGHHPAYAGVGMLEIVNEPIPNDSLISKYYPNALATIRAVEAQYNVPAAKHLSIQMMVRRLCTPPSYNRLPLTLP